MSEPQQHHYLPATYLQGFTNSEGLVFCADLPRRTVFASKPSNLAKRKDYNTGTLKDGTKDRKTVEEFFGTFESSFQNDVREIIKGSQDFEIHRRLLVFITLLKIRSPLSRDLLFQILNSLGSAGKLNDISEEEKSLILKARNGDRMAAQEISLGLSGHLYDPIANQIERMKFSIVNTEDSGSLPTTDNSVQIIGLFRSRKKWFTTLPTPTSEVALFFPLSKSALLVGDSRNRKPGEILKIDVKNLDCTKTVRKYFIQSAELSGYSQMFGDRKEIIKFPTGGTKVLVPNSSYREAVVKILGSIASS